MNESCRRRGGRLVVTVEVEKRVAIVPVDAGVLAEPNFGAEPGMPAELARADTPQSGRLSSIASTLRVYQPGPPSTYGLEAASGEKEHERRLHRRFLDAFVEQLE